MRFAQQKCQQILHIRLDVNQQQNVNVSGMMDLIFLEETPTITVCSQEPLNTEEEDEHEESEESEEEAADDEEEEEEESEEEVRSTINDG